MKTGVFLTFENEFAPLGGLAAVMRVLPKRMAGQWNGPCVTITPFFREIMKCRPDVLESIHPAGIAFSLNFGGDTHAVSVRRHEDARGFRTYFVDSPAFFNAPCDCGDPPGAEAPCNPYVDPADPSQLLRDALFFCAAVPHVLAALRFTKNLVLCLQDWETACAAMTAKQDARLTSVSCVLTLHNAYDRRVSAGDWRVMTDQRISGRTILTKMAAFLDGPVCTVSQHFAHELKHDPVQRKIFAPQLQKVFHTRAICGVDNGTFREIDFPGETRDRADQGDYRPLLKEKAKRRREMVKHLNAYAPAHAWGSLDFRDFEGPVFLFCGRDDPRQKGYDVAAAAIRRVPAGRARYIFAPIPGDEGVEGLLFLKKLAEERAGEVKVFPFRMTRGYEALQGGASFAVMCSFYEPFGSATENYAVGTPVVARATGGLVQQIVPCSSRSLTALVKKMSRRYHAVSAPPTGFLYHERTLNAKATERDWRKILNCGYWPRRCDRVVARSSIPVFQSMVEQAAAALRDAAELYETDQARYARMIANGFHMLEKFSWETAVRRYREVFLDL